jgi:nucleotidyltransferase substrate binding protein (TIGR01987 family)
MSPSTKEFVRATLRLGEALAQKKDEYVRDSVIQRFEFCVELAWKTSRKLMGTATTAPKEVVREMAQNSYIWEVELWLKAIDQRNLSSHTYREEVAEEVYAFAAQFFPELKKLSELVEKK